jgi:hypothetical protein
MSVAVEVDEITRVFEPRRRRGDRVVALDEVALASVLPVTNGLEAIRDTLNGDSAGTIAANAAAEAAVLLGWLTLALASFGRFDGAGRARRLARVRELTTSGPAPPSSAPAAPADCRE